jgi:putative addiction module component (TIGR02574 family)
MARKRLLKSIFDFAFAGIPSANQPSGMTVSARELKKRALALAPADRVELAETLLASVDNFISPEIEAAWRKEVAGRVDGIRSGRAKLIPAEEVHRRARAALNEAHRLSRRSQPEVD